jgi:hypothetical protein
MMHSQPIPPNVRPTPPKSLDEDTKFEKRGNSIPLAGDKDQSYKFESIGSEDTETISEGQCTQVGELVDIWGEIVESEAEKAGEFWKHYFEYKKERVGEYIEVRWRSLQSTGFIQPQRKMEFNKLGSVTVTTYVATLGDDLYFSMRTFIQGSISEFRVLLTFLIFFAINALVFWDTVKYSGYNDWGQWEEKIDLTQIFDSTGNIITLLTIAAIVLGIPLFRGATGEKKDLFEFWRNPIREIYYDEAIALSKIVHNAMMYAANQVGIDTKKLEPRVPFYQQRTKPRI